MQPKVEMQPVEDMIRLENVSVCYRVPRESVSGLKEYAVRRLQGRVGSNTFMALQNVTFSVNKGEVFGLIGHNGAGKSTLLKLVARVLRPSSGRVWLNGRVAPLLELGAGFHPELTGKENIYLNGAILGYNRHEMEEKLPSIVDFAELWDFIDSPIRTYSSGMLARLGFAVATATQPEILIVDEIFAVGDEMFQRKSFERIQQYQEQGTTILLVSHNRRTIEAMCHRVVWLDHGQVKTLGQAVDVLSEYHEYNARRTIEEFIKDTGSTLKNRAETSSRVLKITKVHMEDELGNAQPVYQTGQSADIIIDYQANQLVESPIFGLAIYRQDGIHITGPNTAFSNFQVGNVDGAGKVRYHIPALPLLEGLFYLSVAVVNAEDFTYDSLDKIFPFRVVNINGVKEQYGIITLGGQWSHQQG